MTKYSLDPFEGYTDRFVLKAYFLNSVFNFQIYTNSSDESELRRYLNEAKLDSQVSYSILQQNSFLEEKKAREGLSALFNLKEKNTVSMFTLTSRGTNRYRTFLESLKSSLMKNDVTVPNCKDPLTILEDLRNLGIETTSVPMGGETGHIFKQVKHGDNLSS